LTKLLDANIISLTNNGEKLYMLDTSRLNLGRIVIRASSTDNWAWYGGNHVLVDKSAVENAGASIGDTINLGPYKIKILQYEKSQMSYLGKRVDRPE
jgi:hypothetical protein